VLRATARLCGSLKRDPHASMGFPDFLVAGSRS
jgi:hypothetical protein